MKCKAWTLYFLGNKTKKASICWWGLFDQGMIFPTKKDAQRALKKELEKWSHPNKRLPWKIVSCTIHVKT